MRGLLTLVLLASILVACVDGQWNRRPNRRRPRPWRRPARRPHYQQWQWNHSHESSSEEEPLPPPPPPAPQPIPFPTAIFGQLSPNAVEWALSNLFDCDDTRVKRHADYFGSYGQFGQFGMWDNMMALAGMGINSWPEIVTNINALSQLQNSNFAAGCETIRDDTIASISSAGMDLLCQQLEAARSTYTGCGYQSLIDIIGENCPAPADPTTAAPTTIPTTPASTSTSTAVPTSSTTTPAVPTTPPTTQTTTQTTTSTTTTTTTASPLLQCADTQIVTKTLISVRIVGGTNVASGADYPYYTSMWFTNAANPSCGGTILDQCTIVTASHCVDGVSPSQIHWRVGDHSESGSGTGSLTQHSVASITMHEQYDSNNIRNDIAIIKLDNCITFDNAVQPVCLPTTDFASTLNGEQCTTVGMGTTSSGGTQPDVLMEVSMPTVSGTNCQTIFPSNPVTDPTNQICAGDSNGGEDSCQGDSGGPLFCKINGVDVLSGIVSYGVGCGDAGFPGVYVDVSQYLDWINPQMGNCPC